MGMCIGAKKTETGSQETTANGPQPEIRTRDPRWRTGTMPARGERPELSNLDLDPLQAPGAGDRERNWPYRIELHGKF